MIKDLCFEIIQACPNQCLFCSSKSSLSSEKMINIMKFKETVSMFKYRFGLEKISISGGEPFLHPSLIEMISFCKKLGIHTTLYTSGIKMNDYFVDKEKIKSWYDQQLIEVNKNEPDNERLKENLRKQYERMAEDVMFTSLSNSDFEKVKNAGLDKIVFDWQAIDEQLDNQIMGRRNQLTTLMNSIIRARFSGLDVDVHFVPMKLNYKQFPDIVECLEIAKIKNISILNFVPQGRGLENVYKLQMSKDEMKEFSEILNETRKKFSGNIRVGIPLNGQMTHLCNAGTEKLDIRYDGVILPCPAFKEISLDQLAKKGIQLYSIYDDLEKMRFGNGTRAKPLCKEIYGFDDYIV